MFFVERRNLLCIIFFFELSYATRFTWDMLLILIRSERYFISYFFYDVIVIIEGLSFFALLYVHRKSFKVT